MEAFWVPIAWDATYNRLSWGTNRDVPEPGTTMPSMTAYNFGDVILVPFPFTDQSQAKQRPTVVVSSARHNT